MYVMQSSVTGNIGNIFAKLKKKNKPVNGYLNKQKNSSKGITGVAVNSLSCLVKKTLV